MKTLVNPLNGEIMTKNIVMFDGPEAAWPVRIDAWKSRTGSIYYGKNAEDDARFDGCTHQKCVVCGAVYARLNFSHKCYKCWDDTLRDRYFSLPEVEWDGSWPLSVYFTNKFFFDAEELREYLTQTDDLKAENIRLVTCRPLYGPTITTDIFEDHLMGGREIDDPKILEAIENLNKAIEAHGIFSYEQIRVRVNGQKVARQLFGRT